MVITCSSCIKNSSSNGRFTQFINSIEEIRSYAIQDSSRLDSGQVLYNIVAEKSDKSQLFVKLIRYPNNIVKAVIRTDSERTFNGKSVWYYPNGSISSIGYYAHSKRDGLWRFYYKNGKKSSESFFSEGELFGPSTYYALDGGIENYVLYAGTKDNEWFYSVKVDQESDSIIEEGFPYAIIGYNAGASAPFELISYNFFSSRFPSMPYYLDVEQLSSSIRELPVDSEKIYEIYPGVYGIEVKFSQKGNFGVPMRVLKKNNLGELVFADSVTLEIVIE